MKFLLVLAVLIVAISALRTLYARFFASSRSGHIRQEKASSPCTPETIIRCQHCGTYFPASEAVPCNAGMVFCSEGHRRRYFSAR